MRTTINLPDHLLDDAKRLALETGDTLTAVIEGALRERLARRSTGRASSVTLTTFGSEGLQPGVDLDDSSALMDLMEDQ